MEHPTVEDFAKLFSENPPMAEAFGRHLAEVCPACGEQLRKVESLMKRFGHWDPEVAVREGLEAEGLFATVMAAGQTIEIWSKEIEAREELQTWGVAWVALERAREHLAEEAQPVQAKELALLAAAIAEHLGAAYHVESVHDLKALAYATAAAAAARPPEDVKDKRLKQVVAAMTALDKGSGAEDVSKEVWELLSRVFR